MQKELKKLLRVNDYVAMQPILERLVREDAGQSQLWACKRYYLAMPSEIIDKSPALSAAMAILCSLSADFEGAERCVSRMRRQQYQCRRDHLAYQEWENYLCCLEMMLPYRSWKNWILAAKAMIDLPGGPRLKLSLTTNRPFIINGEFDLSAYIQYMPKIRSLIDRFVVKIYGASAVGMTEVAIAEAFYDQDKIFDALLMLVGAVPRIERGGDLSVLVCSKMYELFILMITGQVASCKAVYENLKEKLIELNAQELMPNLKALEAWMLMYDNDYPAIDQWLKEDAPNELGEFCTLDRFRYFVKIRCYLIYGKHLTATVLSERLWPVLRAMGRVQEICELDTLMAVSCEATGKREKAFALLDEALELAQKYNFPRVIADEGYRVWMLMKEYARKKTTSAWFKSVMKMTHKIAVQYPNYLKERKQDFPRLSSQEDTLLHLIAAGHSTVEIAGFMDVSVNTVKYHSKNLYLKLGVNSRAQAVQLAHEVGLL